MENNASNFQASNQSSVEIKRDVSTKPEFKDVVNNLNILDWTTLFLVIFYNLSFLVPFIDVYSFIAIQINTTASQLFSLGYNLLVGMAAIYLLNRVLKKISATKLTLDIIAFALLAIGGLLSLIYILVGIFYINIIIINPLNSIINLTTAFLIPIATIYLLIKIVIVKFTKIS